MSAKNRSVPLTLSNALNKIIAVRVASNWDGSPAIDISKKGYQQKLFRSISEALAPDPFEIFVFF
jgi:hypothetical protein